jgi:hypothetical protein
VADSQVIKSGDTSDKRKEGPMQGSRSIIATAIAIGLLAGPTVGVTAQEEDASPSPLVEFTGHLVCGRQVHTGTSE